MAYDPELGRVFLFDEADLEANRSGRLSEEQERMQKAGVAGLRRHARFSRRMVIVLILVVLAVVLVMSQVVPGGPALGSTEMLIIVGIILAFGALMLLLGRKNSTIADSVERSELQTVEGPIEWDSDILVGSDVLVVQKVRFRVDRLLAQTVEVGATYSVHYMQSVVGPTIISLERTAD